MVVLVVVRFAPVMDLVVLFCSDGGFNGYGALVFGDATSFLGGGCWLWVLLYTEFLFRGDYCRLLAVTCLLGVTGVVLLRFINAFLLSKSFPP
jgi:hypothetical protein